MLPCAADCRPAQPRIEQTGAVCDSSFALNMRVVVAAGEEHVLTQFYSSRTLRHAVLASAEGGSAAAVAFVETLWSGVFDGRCKAYLGALPARIYLSPDHGDPLCVCAWRQFAHGFSRVRVHSVAALHSCTLHKLDAT